MREQSIELQIRTSEPNYVKVHRPAVESNLSMEALGLLAYCLSKPKSWIFYKSQLRDRFKVGKDKLDKTLKELEENGFLKSEQQRGGNGEFSRMVYIFTDIPGLLDDTHFSPQTDFPLTGKPLTVNQPLVNINNISKKEKETSSTSFPDEFLDLWNKYGKVGDKLPSFKAWKKLSSTEQQKALGAVGAYVASTVKDDSENGVGKAWRPRRKHLSTWLNSRAWEEEVIVKEEPVETEEERRVRLRFEELQAQMNEYDRKIREFTEYWDARIFGDVSKLPEDAYIEIRDLNLEKSSITPAYQHYKMLYDRQTKK